MVTRATQWKRDNPERAKALRLAYYARNRDKLIEKGRLARLADPEAHRAAVRRHRDKKPADHGAEHRRRKEKLAGRPKPLTCEACGNDADPICWDHDHMTGAFRGWLCEPCNKSLGMARDDVPRLKALVAYLEKPGE